MPVTSHSARLRTRMQLLLPLMSQAGHRFWNHHDLGSLYPRYLVAVHTMIRASVPLMVDALRITEESYLDTPAGPPLAEYLRRHIPEEMHHDEWLLEDLGRIGLPGTVATEHVPSTTVAALVGAQYYYIRHVHPAVLLGYIGVLEGYPPAESLAQQAAERTGYPLEAFRTLRKHAHLDPHHRDDLDAALDRLPVDDRLWSMIGANALFTMDQVIQLIDEISTGALSSRLAHELVTT
jgi:heme oxygenase-like protein